MSFSEVHFWPDDKRVQVRPGTTLLEAGRKARVNIRTRCGAKAACLMCKVIVKDSSGLAPMNQNERLKLGSQVDEGYRLACQARVAGCVDVILPEDPLKAVIRAQLAKQREEDDLF
ncbi:2Fe-2S iron-sulfur cluster binding domain-containing protein [Paenibacillus sp. SYP-B3998]|uniref:2Fe-2S iron-sulfur cluster binding domain-containing protein n=1 Tax=Paenibacillus sp. SYP-B3998 TaxID=2678564 RepID=A0A6G3ZWX6_9BACL|nr:2Fe-2S iron-sulfur cluster-binding protein [Paenibacillus sp. SYP-B3998]NEW06089.1 2Fe-2S iron-sulfur cluster binding domain-containing protein [Paenibacillus sp. SYP-B3998]